tara:strand:- start:509 stop:1711 length:1203 start_codon:yes stop_codon:yes gene_type:complete
MKVKKQILNTDDLGKFVIPNGNKIRSIRETEFQIPQSNIERFFKLHDIKHSGKDGKVKSNVSLRTYQRIEDGIQINKRFVKDVARLFTKLYQSRLKKEIYVGLEDLILDAGIVKDPKSFDIYLNRISSFEELIKLLNLTLSKYTKSFFNCKIGGYQQIFIEDLYNEINQINSYNKKENNPNDEIGFKKDLELLKLSTKVNNTFGQLKNEKICAYMGVLKGVPVVDTEVITNPIDNSPYKGAVEIVSQISSKVELRDYLIINFTDCNNGFSIDMNFKSDYTTQQLEKIIKENPYSEEIKEVVDYSAYHEFGFGLPDEKVSEKAVKFYKSKKIDLPWSLRKNQFNFKSSLEDTKMIFEDYDEFIDAARETFKDEIERSEAEQAAADDAAYEMYKENEWDDKK